MRAWLALLVLLLGLAGAAPACAQGMPMTAATMAGCHGSGAAAHHDCDRAACIGCATLLPEPVHPEAPAPAAGKSVAVAAPIQPLAGILPAAESRPPRLPA